MIALALTLTVALAAPAMQPPRAIATNPATREQQIAQAADALRAKLVDQRRDFHIHPELSNREGRTARLVAEPLTWEPEYGRPAEAQALWEARHGRALPHPSRSGS